MFQTTTHFKIFIFQTSLQWSSWYDKLSKRKAKGYLALCLQLTSNMFGWSKSQMWWFFFFVFPFVWTKETKARRQQQQAKVVGRTWRRNQGSWWHHKGFIFRTVCLSAHFLKTEGETKRCNQLRLIYGDEVNFASRDLSAAGCAALKGTCGWEHHFLRQWTNASVLPTEFVWVEKKNPAQLCNLFLNPLAPTENRTRHKQKGPNWQTEVISESMGTNTHTHTQKERVSW